MSQVAAASSHSSPLLQLLDREFASDEYGLPSHLWERALGQPAREFLRRPGKRFRARLVETAWLLAGGATGAMPVELPLIVEILHAGSLIVDDIEDGSHERRNAPSLHRIYGIPQALNTGNWLYFWPFELIQRLPLSQLDRDRMAHHTRVTLLRCHRGQALDIALRVTDLKQSEIPRVVRATTRLKTSALMELAAVLGAIAAGASQRQIEVVERFARELGTGLQMLDDVGSIACASRLHKGVEDLSLGRPTWPWAWAAIGHGGPAFASFIEQEHRVITGRGSATELARRLCVAVADTGRQRVHTKLGLALAVLEDNFDARDVIDIVAREVERLEKSYG